MKIYILFRLFLFCPIFILLFLLLIVSSHDPSPNFEREIQRILQEQELVTKRSREFESLVPLAQQQPISGVKVGFAAVQEMARLQEQSLVAESSKKQDSPEKAAVTSGVLPPDTSDLSFLRFNPNAGVNKIQSPSPPPKMSPSDLPPGPKGLGRNAFGKFPLEIPTPIHSPKVGLKRFGSFR